MGLFSAIATTFIIQIIPQLQPNPADLTNVLLLQILEQNTSFDGTDPLAPISNIPAGIIKAQAILFASLSITGEYRRSREGAPGQALRTAEVGVAPDHGVVARHVAVCSPPFWRRPYRLPLGSEHFYRGSGVSGHFCRPRLLRHGSNDLERLPIPDTLIRPRVIPWTKGFIALVRVWLRRWWRRRTTSLVLRIKVVEPGVT